MNKFKRILVFALVAVMMMPAMFNVNVLAVDNPTDEELINSFTEGIFDLTNKDMFIDLVELFDELSDPSGFSTAYNRAFPLLAGYQQDRLGNYQLTTDAVAGFTNFLRDDEFSVEAVRNYITTNDKAGFKTQISERVEAFKSALPVGVDQDVLRVGFAQMDKVFSIINSLNEIPDSLKDTFSNFKFLSTKSVGGDFTFIRDNATVFILIANISLDDPIDSYEPVLNAMQKFVDYYNNDLGSTDKNLVYYYLYNNNFVNKKSSGSPSGGNTPDPEPEPTTPEETQNQVEEKAKVEIKPVVSSIGTIQATVRSTDLTNAWEKTQDAVEEVEQKTEEANKVIEKKVVLEVPETKEAEKIAVALPVLDIKKLEDDGMDAIKVNSQVGSVEFSTADLIEEDQTAREIIFSMEDVSEKDHEGVPEGSVVVEFNLHIDGNRVSKFRKPIKIAIPYVPKEGDNLDEITVYFLQDDGTSIPVGGVYNPITKKVDFTTNHFSKYYAKVSRVSFSDVKADYWAKDYIEILAGKGIINGRPNNIFDASANITRAEFVVLVSRMLSLVETDEAMPFTDVEETEWYANGVLAAYQAGLVNGKLNNKFAPNAPITRQEVAVVVTNVLDYLGYTTEEDTESIKEAFVDYDKIESWANKSVSTAFREEIINGKPNKVFDPTGNTTRAEVAKMIYKLFKK